MDSPAFLFREQPAATWTVKEYMHIAAPLSTPVSIASESGRGSVSSSREREEAASPAGAVKREAPELLVPKREAAEVERDSPAAMETRHAGYGAPPDQRSPYERPPDDHVRSYR